MTASDDPPAEASDGPALGGLVRMIVCLPFRLAREAGGLVPDVLSGPRSWVGRRIEGGIGEVESALRGLGLLPATDDERETPQAPDDARIIGDRHEAADDDLAADRTPIAGMPEPAQSPSDVAGPAPSDADLAIPDYDSLSASQVVPRLDGLTDDELEDVRRHEEAGRGRRTILSKIAQLQAG